MIQSSNASRVASHENRLIRSAFFSQFTATSILCWLLETIAHFTKTISEHLGPCPDSAIAQKDRVMTDLDAVRGPSSQIDKLPLV